MKAAPFYASVILVIFLNPKSCEEKPEHTFVQEPLPSCSEQFISDADFVIANQFGLNVQNLKHNIFRFPSKKAPWKPITGFRATVGGRLEKYKVESEAHPEDREYDWNLELHANRAFAPSMGNEKITGEITPALDLRDNRIFPPEGSGKKSPLVDREICMYGPWVLDVGNDNGREIHPAEALWWQNTPGSNLDVELMLVQDGAINRFTDACHYTFDEDGDGVEDFQPGWAPWVEYPYTEEIKIPFQYDRGTLRYAVIRIEELRSENIVTELYPELGDDDDGAHHKLKIAAPPNGPFFKEQTLVEVREDRDQNLAVQFTDVCKASNNIIRGNVRLLTAIGKVDTRDPGFIYLRFRISFGTNRPASTQG
jgi:hypothetical protein